MAKEKSIRQKYLHVKKLYSEYCNLKALANGIERFNKEDIERGIKPNTEQLDSVKLRIITLETLLNEHLK